MRADPPLQDTFTLYPCDPCSRQQRRSVYCLHWRQFRKHRSPPNLNTINYAYILTCSICGRATGETYPHGIHAALLSREGR